MATLARPICVAPACFAGVDHGLTIRAPPIYEAAAEAVPEAFGIAKSNVSRRFIRASAHALQQFHARRHRELLVLLLDGKTFAEEQIVIALGVTTTGEKRVLGLVQTATENKRACAAFLSAAQKPDTTNRIESVMAQIERKTQRVDHWRTSDQQQRWVAATLLQIEATFRCVRGFKHLALLQTALTTKLTATAVAA